MSPIACKEPTRSDSWELYYVGECENEDGNSAVSSGQESSAFPYSKNKDTTIADDQDDHD